MLLVAGGVAASLAPALPRARVAAQLAVEDPGAGSLFSGPATTSPGTAPRTPRQRRPEPHANQHANGARPHPRRTPTPSITTQAVC